MASTDPDSAPVPAPPVRDHYDPRVWLLAVGTFAVGTDNLVIAGILPMLARDLDVGLDAAGRLVTAYALAYGLGSPILAAVTGRWRRERAVIWAIGAFAIANLLCAIAPNYTILLIARVAAGLAAAVYTPGSYALAITLSSPRRRGRALSAVQFGISISTVIGVPLGTVIGGEMGWHITFLFIAALSAIAMVALLRARMKSPESSLGTAMSVASRLRPLTRPIVLLALLPNLMWGIGTMSVFTYITPILGLHFGHETIIALLFVSGFGSLVGSFIGGRLADRFGSVRPLLAAFALVAINFIVWGIDNASLVGTAIAMFLWPVCGWSMGAPQQSRIVRLDPPSATVTLAINNATFYFGSSLGAAFGGVMIGLMPPDDLIYVGAILAFAGAGAVGLSVWATRRWKLAV
jgi:predicted MFS family arabinose efflux permease